MKIEIERVSNGYILSIPSEDVRMVFSESGSVSGRMALADALNELVGQFGERGSRYDSERIYVTVAPGDKCEKQGDQEAMNRISEAVHSVEACGCDTRLTECIGLLSGAMSKMREWADSGREAP